MCEDEPENEEGEEVNNAGAGEDPDSLNLGKSKEDQKMKSSLAPDALQIGK